MKKLWMILFFVSFNTLAYQLNLSGIGSTTQYNDVVTEVDGQYNVKATFAEDVTIPPISAVNPCASVPAAFTCTNIPATNSIEVKVPLNIDVTIGGNYRIDINYSYLNQAGKEFTDLKLFRNNVEVTTLQAYDYTSSTDSLEMRILINYAGASSKWDYAADLNILATPVDLD